MSERQNWFTRKVKNLATNRYCHVSGNCHSSRNQFESCHVSRARTDDCHVSHDDSDCWGVNRGHC